MSTRIKDLFYDCRGGARESPEFDGDSWRELEELLKQTGILEED